MWTWSVVLCCHDDIMVLVMSNQRAAAHPGNAIRHIHGYGDTIHGCVAFHWHVGGISNTATEW